jgi:hypothetical protein
MNSSGFVPKRRGVLEHLNDGRLTLQQYGAYDVLILLAHKATGIWFGSAKALAANCGAGDITERQARHVLESLESKGYIKRFPKRRAHGNYPIAIDKYQVTVGAYSRMRLNARASSDWKTPVYDRCEVPGEEPGLHDGVASAPIQERKGEKEEKREEKKCAAASQPASHPLFEIWNENRGQLAEAKVLSKGRLAKCRLRVRDVGEDRFLAAVRKAASTPFCLGLNDRGWRMDFDWLVANDTNATKVIEGRYDGQPREPVWRQKQKLEEQQKAEAVARFEDGN